MLKGFAYLLSFQCFGILLSTWFHLPVPGPVLGMMFLLIAILLIPPAQALQNTSQKLLSYLPLFILPASAGIVDFGPLLRTAWLPLMLALSLSLVVSFILTPHLFQFFLKLFGVRP